MQVELGGLAVRLLAERAVLVEAEATLLAADLHLGKAATFRQRGVPVPHGTSDETLARLSRALEASGARRLVVLGDLLHARAAQDSASTLAAFGRWRARHAGVEVVLVRGNHDRQAGDPPASLGIACVDAPLRLGGLALVHEAAALADAAYTLAGHAHPCVALGRGFDRVRLPCFHLGVRAGTLPAFGAFTGMHALRRAAGDRVVAIADGALVEVPVH